METDMRQIIRDNLSALMKERGWTQVVTSEKTGVSQRTISNILINGTTTAKKLVALADGFGVEAWTLLRPGIESTFAARARERLLQAYDGASSDGRAAIARTADAEKRYASMAPSLPSQGDAER